MEGMIFRLEGVGYRYEGDITGLENVDLEVRRGDVVVLGPNGSGKSTLLKVLDVLYQPTQGKFYAFGEEMTEKKLADKRFNRFFRKNVGLLFQDPKVQLFSTVEDELAFGPRQLGASVEEVEERVNRTIELLNLEGLRGRYPYSLSGGERRKVALGSLLTLDPGAYLPDEPTASLDPQAEGRLIDLLLSLREEGKTLIIAT